MRRPRRAAVLLLASGALVGFDWPGQGAARAREFEHATPSRRVELLHLLAPSTEPAARAAFAAALADPELTVRETARRLAVRYSSAELVPALVRLLAEPDVDARAEALDALAVARTPEARAAVERALSDRSTAVRAHAVRALAEAGPGAVVALLDRVHDAEGEVRAAAAEALGQIGDARGALALVGISQDPLPEVRLAATRALGALGGEVAARALVGLVHDSLPEVRLAALRGLRSHPDPSTVPTLVALARPGLAAALAGRDELARAAVSALSGIDAPEARQALVELAVDPSSRVAREAVAALVPVADRLRPDVDALLARVTRENVEALADLLGRVGGDSVADALLDLLARAEATPGSATAPTAAAIIRALGRTGSDRALQALLERITAPPSPSSAVAARCARGAIDPALLDAFALWADARRGLDPLAVDPLAEALQRVDPACHAPLAGMLRLLALTGNERAAPRLIEALGHPDPTIRLAAAEGLGRVASSLALAPLVRALSDVAVGVRAAAISSLRAQPAVARAPALAARWRDPAPVERGALLLALGDALASPALPAPARAAHLSLLLEAAARGAWRTRSAAVRALGAVAAAGEAESLRAVLVYATEAHLAAVAVEALGNLPATPTGRAVLERSLARGDGALAAAAAWALRAAGVDAAEALVAVVERGRSPAAHNALAALSRVDLAAASPALRARAVAAARRVVDDRSGAGARANACAVIARAGGACEGAPVAPVGAGLEAATSDLRVLDPTGAPVVRPVLLGLPDGVSLWVTPDVDGWVRVVDPASGPLQVLDPDDVAP